MNMKSFKLVIISFFIIVLSACGGGDDGGSSGSSGVSFSGNTDPAAIDDENAEDLGKASGEAVLKADSSDGLPSGISVTGSITIQEVNEIILSSANVLSLPTGQEIPNVCSSGSASYGGDFAETSGPVEFTISYNNCTISGVTFDGTVVFTYVDINDLEAGFSIVYNNFSVTDSYGTTSISMVVECTNLFTCTYNSDFVGADGSTHRVTSFSITGDTSGGFNGSATFIHGEYGEVSISISNVVYNGSCDPYPSGGTISFSSSNGSSGTITFNSNCTVSGTWNDGTSSGTF